MFQFKYSYNLRVVFLLASLLLFAPEASARTPAVKVAMTAANGLFILGGLGLLAAAGMDTYAQQSNTTHLIETYFHIASGSLVTFGAGTVMALVAAEMNKPELLERLDEIATGFTGFGFALIAGGIWRLDQNAIKAGTFFLTSFFASRALLLPLIIQKHEEFLKPSDKILLWTLTGFGNMGGALLTWATFETASYRRELLQAGLYILGITIPVTMTGLTINVWR